jgi:N-acetylglucosamine-6-sulfatase
VLLLTVLISGLTTSPPARAQAAAPRNFVLILSDDHRYDFMSFHPQAPDFLETPQLDRMAARGAHFQNAFVTSSLCSPSRASILTGRYAHNHGIVDNSAPIPPGTRFFPEHLRRAGYATAFIGKWHMGESKDDPQPGFDHWVSFVGQGVYFDPVLNIDGARHQVTGYITDLLTDYALDWLSQQQKEAPERPFFLYLSHKAVHAEFEPAPRHLGRYADAALPYPDTMANSEANYRTKPRWVREQRYGWHGVEHAYHGALDFEDFYRRYAEVLLGLDESIGRVLAYLDQSGLSEETLVIYMGDNGFLLGEHGLIDKRNAYEESIRVPMLAYAPGMITPGTRIPALVRNIDIAPTILDLAGVSTPEPMDGRSLRSVLRDGAAPWNGELLYEYYWEHAFPHTPTVFALRDDRYKYLYYHGIWDLHEFYDLKTDPKERHNLIDVPGEQGRVRAMRERLWDRLEATGGMRIPLRRPPPWQAAERKLPD